MTHTSHNDCTEAGDAVVFVLSLLVIFFCLVVPTVLFFFY